MIFDSFLNKDCLEGIRTLPENSIDMILTSPPYDRQRSYNGDISQWDFAKFKKLLPEMYRVLKPGCVVVWIVNDMTVNGSETGTSFRQALEFMNCGFLLHDTMIWQKISPFQPKNRYIPCFEYMFIFSKGRPNTANIIRDRKNKWGNTRVHGTERQTDGTTKPMSYAQKSKFVKEYGARYNVWEIPPDKHNRTGHPAVFPLDLARDHIRTWSNPGDIVLDPFMGSGTTAIAAMITCRHYVGFEVNRKYYDSAKFRIDTFIDYRKECSE